MFWATLGVVIDLAAISARYKAVKGSLDERARRLVAAAESQAIGRGGISAVSKATGMSRAVIQQGVAELKSAAPLEAGRIRRQGGGRKKAVHKDHAEDRSGKSTGIEHAGRPG